MKSKFFSPMWRVAIALVMVLSFGLMAAPVSAAEVSGVTVVPTDRTAEADSQYTITMTTTVDLIENVDIISIVFPTGFIPYDGDAQLVGDVTVGGEPIENVADYNVTGQRVEITVPSAATTTAGEIIVVIGNAGATSTPVTNPVADSYTLDVYTSKETTAVTSEEFVIAGSADSQLVVVSVVLHDYEVGVAAEYTIELTLGAVLTADTDTITITFPDK